MTATTMHTGLARLSALASAALLAACANLAPTYQTPAAAIPDTWPAAAASAAAEPSQAKHSASSATPGSTGDASAEQDWTSLVLDARLRQVVTLALANNRDLRLAVLAVAKARATYRIDAAAAWPTLSAGASMSASRSPAQASSSGVDTLSRAYAVNVGVAAYELDLFGRVQNLKDAALQTYLGTEAAARSTRLSLVAEVATAWLTLAADRAQLDLARDALASQQRTVDLIEKRRSLGAESGLTLAQAQTGVASARGAVAAYEAQVAQDRHALDLLAGTAVSEDLLPDALGDGAAAALVAVPAGLPSQTLQRRPDVVAVEHQLQAATADIGAARAAFYPSISLTGSAGTASRSLQDLFRGGAWSFVPSISLPIFDGGANQANLAVAELARDEQLATYDKTLQTAFREVADALAVRATLGERLAAQQALVDAQDRTLALAQARHDQGAESYLTVLDAQRSLFTAQQDLISLKLAEQGNRVTLYEALGGA